MPTFFETIFATYLIYPLLGLLMVGLGFFIAKKNALLNNKKLIFYMLVALIVLILPALMGYLDYSFMPWGFIILSLVYLLLGYFNKSWAKRIFSDDYKYGKEAGLTIFLLLVGMLFFALVFNLCNELQYGLWAGSTMLPFAFVSVFSQTCRLFVGIPAPIYKVWNYIPENCYDDLPEEGDIDYGRLQVFRIEVYKQDEDQRPVNINIKVPEDIPFGRWFGRMVADYNAQSPLQPIDDYAGQTNGGWVFHTRPAFLKPRRYIDCDKTIRENKIRSNEVIQARRVKEDETD